MNRYTLLIMDAGGDDEEEVEEVATTGDTKTEMLPSKLNKETQELVNLLFDKDMFNTALKKYDIGLYSTIMKKLFTVLIKYDQIVRC